MAGGDGSARAGVLLATSLVGGVAAMVVLFQVFAGYQARIEAATAPEPTVYAMVAARDLLPGVPITEEDLFAVEIPEVYLHEDVFRSSEHVVGRIPRERVLANELVRVDRLADADIGRGLNALIPRGMRAMSIDVGDGRAVSGFLHPGDYVDVLVTIDHADVGAERIARTITVLEVVPVLAVNDRLTEERMDDEPTKGRRLKPSVTLATTPEEAEALAHAAKIGTITLTLRNRDDAMAGATSGTSFRDILDEPEPPGVPVERKRAPTPATPAAPEGIELMVCRGDVCETVRIPVEP